MSLEGGGTEVKGGWGLAGNLARSIVGRRSLAQVRFEKAGLEEFRNEKKPWISEGAYPGLCISRGLCTL